MPRKEEFPPDGKRIHVDPAVVVQRWRQETSYIPAEYAVGTADHESSFTLNEVDTEESGFQSFGIFQLSEEERNDARLQDGDLCDLLTLDGAVEVMVAISKHRIAAILSAANVSSIDTPPSDLWAYLAFSHNEGLHEALKTIRLHGMDWAAFKARNPSLTAMGRYGDDCITGGASWKPEFNEDPKKGVV